MWLQSQVDCGWVEAVGLLMAGVIQWKEQTMTASEGLVEEVGTWHHEEEEEGDQ